MNAMLLSYILAAVPVALIVLLTHLIVGMSFPDESGLYHCPRWLSLRWFIRWLEWTRPLRRLSRAIHIALAVLQTPGDPEVILSPAEAWQVLHETLALDMESTAFDDGVQEQIGEALARLVYL